MEIQLIKDFLDACHEVKRINELMPALPKECRRGMCASLILFINAVKRQKALR